MTEHGLFHSMQFAYRKGMSTVDAMLNLHDNWMNNIDENKVNVIMMIDLSSAFDKIKHSILLDKMEVYGLDKNVTNWMKSYLSYRTQYVQIEEKESNMNWMKHGVPQGSILGPLLYLIMTNDMPSVSNQNCTHIHRKIETNIYMDITAQVVE